MKFAKHILSIIIASLTATAAWAAPAKPGLLNAQLPDGTTLRVRAIGDEWGHYYLSEDGYLLTRGADDYFYYSDFDSAQGRLQATTMRATDVAERSNAEQAFVATRSKELPQGLRQMPAQRRRMLAPKSSQADGTSHKMSNFPSTGQQRALVILVQFRDRRFTVADPATTFHNYMMQPGFTHENGAHMSVHDFYYGCSNGLFDPQFDVYGPVTLSQNLSYYGGNDAYGNDDKPEEMVIEACQLLDDEIDFSQYDRDGDGWVDNVYIFYAGYSEAEGASANSIWPHSWDIWLGAQRRLVLDGVQIGKYGCSQELNIDNGLLAGIGVFCHEFAHVLGLMDLYSTDYNVLAFTPGDYALMDHGEYSDNSNTPPYFSAYERWVLGWHTPTLIDRAMNATLPPIGYGEVTSYRINTTNENEFYILENRQQQGLDEFIPGHGMLVWHIDFDRDIWTSNDVNNLSTHQRIDIVEADGLQTEESRAGDPFPGVNGISSFTDNTYPSMRDWSGNALGLPITNIAEAPSDGTITFRVLGGEFELEAVTLNEVAQTDITATSFTLSWNSVARATDYLLNLYTTGAAGNEYVQLNLPLGNVNRYTVTGLQPSTTYYATISASDGSHLSAESNVVSATTLEPDFGFYTPTVLEAWDVTGSSFVARWDALDGATDYYLTVYDRNNSGDLDINIDFSDAADSFPDGWTTNCNSFVMTQGCFGAAAPALAMRQNGSYVLSPLYNGEIRQVSFWYRGQYMDPSNVLALYASTDGVDYNLVDYLNVTLETGEYRLYGDGQEITLPASTRQVALQYNKSDGSTGGFIYLDDLRLMVEAYDDPVVLEGYDNLHVGNVLQYAVTSLQPLTEYLYSVRAHDGEQFSLQSPQMSVTTTEGNSTVTLQGGDEAAIYTLPGRLVARGSAVQVFNIAGQQVAQTTGPATIELPAGIYIVKSKNNSVKKVIITE